MPILAHLLSNISHTRKKKRGTTIGDTCTRNKILTAQINSPLLMNYLKPTKKQLGEYGDLNDTKYHNNDGSNFSYLITSAGRKL